MTGFAAAVGRSDETELVHRTARRPAAAPRPQQEMGDLRYNDDEQHRRHDPSHCLSVEMRMVMLTYTFAQIFIAAARNVHACRFAAILELE